MTIPDRPLRMCVPGPREFAGPREPQPDCSFCPRLVSFREENQAKFPDWFNAPVPSFGPLDARLVIVGLAPGLKGANRTGRPLPAIMPEYCSTKRCCDTASPSGTYAERPDDGLVLTGCTNHQFRACVPPQNKPLPDEIAACRGYFKRCIGGNAKLARDPGTWQNRIRYRDSHGGAKAIAK